MSIVAVVAAALVLIWGFTVLRYERLHRFGAVSLCLTAVASLIGIWYAVPVIGRLQDSRAPSGSHFAMAEFISSVQPVHSLLCAVAISSVSSLGLLTLRLISLRPRSGA